MLPSGLAANARGVSAKKERISTGVPPMVLPRLRASKTHTSARPMPSVVSCGSPAPVTAAMEASVRCWPRCAVVMKARFPEAPAKTMSRGSSPTSSVRTTRGGEAERSTMLTLSERWLTTHTSSFVRAATATGSIPTGIESTWVRPPPPTSKTSRRLSGVLTANNWPPSGDRASGRTWPLSKVMKEGWANAAAGTPNRARAAATAVSALRARCIASGPPRTVGRSRKLS